MCVFMSVERERCRGGGVLLSVSPNAARAGQAPRVGVGGGTRRKVAEFVCTYVCMYMHLERGGATTLRCDAGWLTRSIFVYARRMGQPTQRATNYTARSNIDTAQIFLHANGQRPKRAMIRQRSRRRQRRGELHTEHDLGVLLARDRRKSLCVYVCKEERGLLCGDAARARVNPMYA